MPSYDTVVAADSPTHWWKCGDASGTSLADSAASGTRALAVTGGLTLGQTGIPGSPTNTAALFTTTSSEGTEGGAVYLAPNPVSMELWFKTTTSGGLGSFSSSTASFIIFNGGGSFDRQIGLNAGKVHVYSYPNTMDSTLTYNDGNWHHAALTLPTSGTATLYVDGSSVATMTSSLSAYSGLWYVGNNPNTAGAGPMTVAHVAVYEGVVLTSTQISNHYNAGITPPIGGNLPLALNFAATGMPNEALAGPTSWSTPEVFAYNQHPAELVGIPFRGVGSGGGQFWP